MRSGGIAREGDRSKTDGSLPKEGVLEPAATAHTTGTLGQADKRKWSAPPHEWTTEKSAEGGQKTDKVVHALECMAISPSQLGPLKRAKSIPILMDPFAAQLGQRVCVLPQQAGCKLLCTTKNNVSSRTAEGLLRAG